jgi:hypothetical protein
LLGSPSLQVSAPVRPRRVTNRFGSGLRGLAKLIELGLVAKTGGNVDETLTRKMWEQNGRDGGSVSLLKPDGSPYPGSPFTGGGLPGPWAAVVDGDDNVWLSNFSSAGHTPLVELCGVRIETCPPGYKTGEQIAPPGGYVGGGLQAITDLAIGPAGDVWLMNNWQNIDSCFGDPDEALSTRCGGQGSSSFMAWRSRSRRRRSGRRSRWSEAEQTSSESPLLP